MAVIIAVIIGLNRTFYGIETTHGHYKSEHRLVLIVPFMELKQIALVRKNCSNKS